MEQENPKGFIKKKIIMIISTEVGDHWKNTENCEFIEAKNGYLVVEPKDKTSE